MAQQLFQKKKKKIKKAGLRDPQEMEGEGGGC